MGGIINTYKGGTLKNTHWLDSLSAPVYPAEALQNSGALSEDQMKTMDFVNALNENKGENGTSWGQSSTGYAYFGENQTYVPGGDNSRNFREKIQLPSHLQIMMRMMQ